MPIELEQEVDALVRAAGEMWVAAVRLDENLDESDLWHLAPEGVFEQYVACLKDLAAAYGRLRSKQYERQHAQLEREIAGR